MFFKFYSEGRATLNQTRSPSLFIVQHLIPLDAGGSKKTKQNGAFFRKAGKTSGTKNDDILQVLPVALLCPLLHDELPDRQLHLAPSGVHAAHLRLPLHLQLRAHLQHHVPRVPPHLLLL